MSTFSNVYYCAMTNFSFYVVLNMENIFDTWNIQTISTFLTGFRIRIFFADPDPGKNLHADPDPVPDPGGIRGRGLGVKGKNDFFLSFFHVSDDS